MILNNCRLIPALTDGISTEIGSVEIKQGKIVKINREPVASELSDFDCEGKTLLPGLIDLHTHLTLLGGIGVDSVNEPMKLLIDAASQAKKFLDYGYTTIRDCGSIKRGANYVRDMIQKGLITGPDVLACGQTLMSSVVNKDSTLGSIINFVDGVEEFRKATREEAAHHADFIKIYASGSALNPTGVPKHPIMTREEIRVSVETAKMNGLTVAAHCHADEAIRVCVEEGVKTIEHATYLSEESLALIKQTNDCYLVPTFSAMYVSQTDPEQRAFWTARLAPMLDSCSAAIECAYKAGLKMGFGTDCAPNSLQYDTGTEFRMRKEYCHMENIDILLQATKYNAEIADIDHLVGQIKEGLQADLILVDGNPDEDLSIMYQQPLHVWKKGKRVK